MNDTERLAAAVAALATTITEIINQRLQQSAAGEQTATPAPNPEIEGWVGKKEVAQHLNISLRTLGAWMAGRAIPYMRLGRSVRFKLSDVDAALSRKYQLNSRY